jgi:hypothetical protein
MADPVARLRSGGPQLGTGGTCGFPVGVQRFENARTEHNAAWARLALAHVGGHALAIDFRHLQRRSLADAQAGAICQQENGTVLGRVGGGK